MSRVQSHCSQQCNTDGPPHCATPEQLFAKDCPDGKNHQQVDDLEHPQWLEASDEIGRCRTARKGYSDYHRNCSSHCADASHCGGCISASAPNEGKDCQRRDQSELFLPLPARDKPVGPGQRYVQVRGGFRGCALIDDCGDQECEATQCGCGAYSNRTALRELAGEQQDAAERISRHQRVDERGDDDCAATQCQGAGAAGSVAGRRSEEVQHSDEGEESAWG